MNVQHWAVLFVAILSCNYASAFFFGRYKGVGSGYDDNNHGYYGWSKGCSCRGKLTTRLDSIFDRIKPKLARSHDLLPQSLEEYQLKEGRCSGLHKFERKGPYRCSVTRDYARIFFTIRFSDLRFHYKLSFLPGVFSTFMGGFASFMERFFGRITDFVFRCAFPDVFVSLVFRQDFSADGGLYLEGFYPSKIEKINFLDDRFGKHSHSLTPYFCPLFDHVLRHVFDSVLRVIFRSSFSTVSVSREMFSYKYGGHYHHWSSYGGDGSGEESSSGDWDGSSSYSTSYTDSDTDSGSTTYTYEVEEDDSSE